MRPMLRLTNKYSSGTKVESWKLIKLFNNFTLFYSRQITDKWLRIVNVYRGLSVKTRPGEFFENGQTARVTARLEVLLRRVRVARASKCAPHVLWKVSVTNICRSTNRLIKDVVGAEDFVKIARVAAIVRCVGLSHRECARVIGLVVRQSVGTQVVVVVAISG
jgi:hypothetical protein